MKFTEQLASEAFTQWLIDYNNEPEKFSEEYGEPEEYGPGAAQYFMLKLEEAAGKRGRDG
jgi:hypothetical protein